MTTGFATPAGNAPTYQQHERAEMQARLNEEQQLAWMELGYQTLGYVQQSQKQNGQLVGLVWMQARPEQTAGLPPALVEKAKQAIAAEFAARAAFQAKDQQARSDIARMGLTGTAAEYHQQITRGEAWTAYQASLRPTRHALRDLGQIAEEAAQIRAVLAAAPRKRAQVEQQYQQQLAQIDSELQSARLRAAALGIS